ncbi:TetR/AcrR family transcriptional regulator [Leeia aquatica]|uniref:TetR/AcrR family transcriptional regulator n=1 Tax=Leeia aquatica TaxID=2725557 RepID=A0A847S3J9_9NEIS|nr:TetR/AcrR family transcriptional regulator [Leeia aquatica]NLR74334.1 TetR/AcrR family transcriptional regulator [Leeia aquatica]
MSKDRQQQVAAKRKQILEAALACFIHKGFHQTGMREIADRAHISVGNLYNHFPGKSELVAEIAALESEEMAACMQPLWEAGPALPRLRRFVHAYLCSSMQFENVMLTVEVIGEALRNSALGKLFTANRLQVMHAMVAVMEQGIEEGTVSAEGQLQEVASMMIDAIEGVAIRLGFQRRTLSEAEQWEQVDLCCRLLRTPGGAS